MRKILASLLALGLVFSLAITPVAATDTEQGTGENEETTIVEEVTDLEEGEELEFIAEEDMDAGDIEALEEEEEGGELEIILTPESPFYFLKRFIESVRLLLTFDQEKKLSLLEELAEERAKELEMLESLYAEGELSEAQLSTLEKALDDLILYTERLIGELIKLEGLEEPDFEEELDEEGLTEEQKPDKYQWRIEHLQTIADRAPAAAQNGLARAMANAERQRERAIAKGKIGGDDTENANLENEELESGDPENGEPESGDLENGELENGELENDEDVSGDGPPTWAPEHARERWEWSQTGQEGPPPWANGRNNSNGNGKGN
jgi:hypothetical protein